MERYEAYKDSGIEWIGEIPAGWEYGRLKQRNAIAGRIGWQGLTSDEYCDEGPYLITGVNFTNGIVDWNSCVHITDERWEEASQIQIVDGDLLITKDGTIGKVAIAANLHQRASLNSGVMVIRPTTDSQDVRYLFWLLQSGVFWGWFSDINSGNSTIIHLYQGDFLNFDYYLPPVDEQHAIARFLDSKTAKMDALVADCEREVELLQEYRKAVISEVVTKGLDPDAPMKDSGIDWIGEIPEHWEIRRTKTYLTLRDERNSKPLELVNLISLYTDLGVVQHADLEKTTGNKAMTADGYKIVHRGDIVVNIILCWMGAIGLSDFNGVTSPAYDVYRVSEQVCPRYLHYLFRTSAFGGECYKHGRGIMAMRWRTYSDQFGTIWTPFPSVNEQKGIASYLDTKTAEIDSLIDAKQSMADKLREYRRSLISEAVTGKFKVPNLQSEVADV